MLEKNAPSGYESEAHTHRRERKENWHNPFRAIDKPNESRFFREGFQPTLGNVTILGICWGGNAYRSSFWMGRFTQLDGRRKCQRRSWALHHAHCSAHSNTRKGSQTNGVKTVGTYELLVYKKGWNSVTPRQERFQEFLRMIQLATGNCPSVGKLVGNQTSKRGEKKKWRPMLPSCHLAAV